MPKHVLKIQMSLRCPLYKIEHGYSKELDIWNFFVFQLESPLLIPF